MGDSDVRTGLVLSGGGARGAYEAGVIAGISDVLDARGVKRLPVDVLTGTSVGAINAAWCAGSASEPGWDMQGLLERWHALHIEEFLELDLRSLGGLLSGGSGAGRVGWSILRSRALERVVTDAIPWQQLHRNVSSGLVKAVVVPALHVADGVTTVFVECAPGVEYRPSRDPRRRPVFATLSADHVLASAALPYLFPARRIGDDYYCDGGLRFNTPIAPAIRVGCDRLIVISLLSEVSTVGAPSPTAEGSYPNPIFLAGKLLNALLLDPVRHDLDVLARTNEFVDAVEQVVGSEELDRIREAHRKGRGAHYRRIETLVFAPSRNVAHMAREHASTLRIRRLSSWLLGKLTSLGLVWEADLLSFVMFDGAFTRQLTELGYHDARSGSDRIARFFQC